MKTVLVFRADGKLQAIFKMDDEEKFKIVMKTIYDFPYYVEVLDDIPSLSTILNVEHLDDNQIKLSANDAYKSSKTLKVYENVVTTDDLRAVCTLEKFNKIFK